jgi:hypothetical protein
MNNNILDSFSIVGDNNWHSASFTAPSTSTFKVYGGLSASVEVVNKPCALINEDIRTGNDIFYFYVPAGTPSILVELYNSDNGTKLYDPNGNLAVTIDAGGYGGVNNPTSGLWKLDFKGESTSATSYFKIFGVPDLTGYRPQYLLIEDTDAPAPPVLNPISNNTDINCDGVVNILDLIRVVQHWGETGSNGWIVEDVNYDGRIGILDIIVIGQHWTG